MILIFTGNTELNIELNQKLNDSRIVYYPEYILQEQDATILITTIQNNMFNFKDFMFNVRNKDIRIILILENDEIPELVDALKLGIYDIIFDPFSIKDIEYKIYNPTPFSKVSNYIQKYL